LEPEHLEDEAEEISFAGAMGVVAEMAAAMEGAKAGVWAVTSPNLAELLNWVQLA